MNVGNVRTRKSLLKHFDFLVLDVVITASAYVIACLLRLKQINYNYSDIYQNTFVIMVVLNLLLQVLTDCHRDILKRGYFEELLYSFQYMTTLSIMVLVIQFVLRSTSKFARGAFIYFWFIGILMIWLFRSCLKLILRKRYSNIERLQRVLIASSDVRLAENVEYFKHHVRNRYNIVAVAVAKRANPEMVIPDEIEGIPVIKSEREMYDFAGDNVIEEVILSISDSDKEKEIVREMLLMGITSHINLDRVFSGMPNMYVEDIADQLMITSSISPSSPIQSIIKRSMDIVGGIVGLLITGIAFIIIFPIIKIQSPGPVFFSQTRVGKNGKTFKIYNVFAELFQPALCNKVPNIAF